MRDGYRAFLEAKVPNVPSAAFEIEPSDVNPILKPHQRIIVLWMVRGGRRACFASFGLGKTLIQLEVARLVLERSGGRALIVIPLGVRQEFMHDAAMLGTAIRFIRSIEEAGETGIYLTNYETVRDGKLGAALAARRRFASSCASSPAMGRRSMNACAAATYPTGSSQPPLPSPNDFIELLSYAAYLGVMDVSAAKTRFFKRNSEKADNLTLHPHKEREFWLWVASWAVFVQRPSDITGNVADDEGYDLPPLDVRWHMLPTDHRGAGSDREGQSRMFKSAALGVVEASREKRDSLGARIAKMTEIINADPDDHFLLWHDLEAERHAIEAAVPGVRTVYGAQDLDEREEIVIDFSEGRIARLGAKPVMLGSGCNLQRFCHRAIFVGIGFKFAQFIQAVHRIQRFLQLYGVRLDLLYTEAEANVKSDLERKWKQHDELVANMTEIIREYGLSHAEMARELTRAMGVERVEVSGKTFTLVNNDCVDETRRMESNSVGLILTSIPFSSQYEYSPNYCYDEQTQVLTRRGWLSFGDVTLADTMATMNLESRAIEWNRPSFLIWERYRGPMLHFSNRNNFDLLVTPDHAMIADTRVGNAASSRREMHFSRVSAERIAADFVPRKWRLISAATPGSGDTPASVEIPLAPPNARGPERRRIKRIYSGDFMEIAGWYLSEGYCDKLDGGHAGRIAICQTDAHPEFRQEIVALFERIGLPAKPERRAIVAYSADLSKFLVETFGDGSYHKHIPRWVKDLHPELLVILRDTMMKGDGARTGYAYTSFSDRLRDDFQEICILTGWRAAISKKNVYIGRRQIFPEVRRAPTVVEYDGMIGCAKVANGTLVVRRRGVAVVSGNCDFGHSDNNEHFFQQMDFLSPELLRVLKPGRIAAIHVKDRIVPSGMTGLGFQVVYPFHARCIEHYTRHGFAYMGMKTIVTDVVRENAQTYRLGWSEQCKDGTKMGVGMPEYLLIFRKPPTDTINSYADEPVEKAKPLVVDADGSHVPFGDGLPPGRKEKRPIVPGSGYSRSRWQVDAHGFTRSDGNRPLMPEDFVGIPHERIFKLFRKYSLENVYNFEHHVRLGEELELRGSLPVTFMLLQPQSWSPEVWSDIVRMVTFNNAQSAKGKEMHLCPMAFDLADRAIEQWSEPGDVVYDPFSGLATVPCRAVLKRRFGRGTELAVPYFLDGVGYCKAAEEQMSMPSLFDLAGRQGE